MEKHKQIQHDKYYKILGVRTPNTMLRPRVIRADEFAFPKESKWFWYSEADIIVGPSEGVGLLKTRDAKVFIPDTYIQPNGSMKQTKSTSAAIKAATKQSGMKVITDERKIDYMSMSDVVVYNFSLLDYMHRYNSSSTKDVDRMDNTIKTILGMARGKNKKGTRHIYIDFTIPDILNKDLFRDLDKMVTLKAGHLAKLNLTFKTMFLLEIWKMLDKDNKSSSYFNSFTEKDLINVTLVVRYGVNVTLLNLHTLFGFVESYGFETKARMSDDQVRKVFFLYLIRVKNGAPKTMAEHDDSVLAKFEEHMDDDDIDNVESFLDNEFDAKDEKGIKSDEAQDVLQAEVVKEKRVKVTRKEIETINPTIEENLLMMNAEGTLSTKKMDAAVRILRTQAESGLAEKLKITPEELNIDEKDIMLPDNPTVLEKSMLRATNSQVIKQYLTKVYRKDMLNMIYKLQDFGIMIEDVEIETEGSVVGKYETFIIKFRPIEGLASTGRIRMPVIDSDGVIRTNNNQYRLSYQAADLPIRKRDYNIIGLSSFYGKLSVYSGRKKNNDIGHYYYKQLVKKVKERDPFVKMVVSGTDFPDDVYLPIAYTHFSRWCAKVAVGGMTFDFVYAKRHMMLRDGDKLDVVEKDGNILVGVNRAKYWVMDKDGNMFIWEKGKLKPERTLIEIFDIDVSKVPIEYATVTVTGEDVPVGLLLCYYIGLDSVNDMLNIEPEEIGPNNRVLEQKPDDVIVRLADTKLVYRNCTLLQKSILGGLQAINGTLKNSDIIRLDSGNIGVIGEMGYSNKVISEFNTLKALFIDPSTEQILEEMKEPTTLPGLLIRSAELLLDDRVTNKNNFDEMLLKGYDRIPGLMYHTLIKAVKTYSVDKAHGNARIDISPFEAWAAVANDSTLGMIEDINPIVDISQQHDATYTGHGGRSIDTMTKATREFHKSHIGMASGETKDSGAVGVSFKTPADVRIGNIRGMKRKGKFSDMTFSNKLSVSMNNAVGVTLDDPKRANFVGIQNGHVVASPSNIILPMRTGYDSVIAMRSADKYCVTAKGNCTVTKVSGNSITVKYKDGEEKFNLYTWYSKEDNGTTYAHKVVTGCKVGQKLIAGHAITYDSGFFGPDMLAPGFVALKNGFIVRLAFIEDYATYEDSFGTTPDGARKLNSWTSKVKEYRLNHTDAITHICELGQKVDVDTNILQFAPENKYAGDKFGKKSLETLGAVKANNMSADIVATIGDVVMLYNCELDDMTKTMRNIAIESDKRLARIKGKGITGRVPKTFSTGGVPVAEGEVVLKIYMETETPPDIADKVVVANQLKATLGKTFKDRIWTGTVDNKDPIEGMFGHAPVGARIVTSPFIIGTGTALLQQIGKRVLEM